MNIFQRMGFISVFVVSALGAMDEMAIRPDVITPDVRTIEPRATDATREQVQRLLSPKKVTFQSEFNFNPRSGNTMRHEAIIPGQETQDANKRWVVNRDKARQEAQRKKDEVAQEAERARKKREEEEALGKGRSMNNEDFVVLKSEQLAISDIRLSEGTRKALQDLNTNVLAKIKANPGLAGDFNKVFKLNDFADVMGRVANSGKITADDLISLQKCKSEFVTTARSDQGFLDKSSEANWTKKNANFFKDIMVDLSKVQEQLSNRTINLEKVEPLEGILKDIFLTKDGFLSEKAIDAVEGVNFLDRKSSTGAQIASGAVAVLGFSLFAICLAGGLFVAPFAVIGLAGVAFGMSFAEESAEAQQEYASGKIKKTGQGRVTVRDWQRGKNTSIFTYERPSASHSSTSGSSRGNSMDLLLLGGVFTF